MFYIPHGIGTDVMPSIPDTVRLPIIDLFNVQRFPYTFVAILV